MKEKAWELSWEDKFISGNDELDKQHQDLVNGVIKLYKIISTTNRSNEDIKAHKDKIEKLLISHIDLEEKLLKKYMIPNHEKHIESHNKYRKEIELYNRYKLPKLLQAIMVSETIFDYMKNHFLKFDVFDIPLINKKLKKLE